MVEKYFRGTANKIEGVSLNEIEKEMVKRHSSAFNENIAEYKTLDVGGDLAYRVSGEEHVWTPETIKQETKEWFNLLGKKSE